MPIYIYIYRQTKVSACSAATYIYIYIYIYSAWWKWRIGEGNWAFLCTYIKSLIFRTFALAILFCQSNCSDKYEVIGYPSILSCIYISIWKCLPRAICLCWWESYEIRCKHQHMRVLWLCICKIHGGHYILHYDSAIYFILIFLWYRRYSIYTNWNGVIDHLALLLPNQLLLLLVFYNLKAIYIERSNYLCKQHAIKYTKHSGVYWRRQPGICLAYYRITYISFQIRLLCRAWDHTTIIRLLHFPQRVDKAYFQQVPVNERMIWYGNQWSFTTFFMSMFRNVIIIMLSLECIFLHQRPSLSTENDLTSIGTRA